MNESVELPIPAVMEWNETTSTPVPTMIEHHDAVLRARIIAKHEQLRAESGRDVGPIEPDYEVLRTKQFLDDVLKTFDVYNEADRELIKKLEPRLRTKAKRQFEEAADFKDVIIAAKFLDLRNDKSIFQRLLKRFETLQQDERFRVTNTIAFHFTAERACQHAPFVAEVRKQLAKGDADQYETAASILSQAGIDREPLVKLFKRKLLSKETKDIPNHDWRLAWLLKVVPDMELLDQTEAFLRQPNSGEYADYDPSLFCRQVVKQVLQTGLLQRRENHAQRDRIRDLIIGLCDNDKHHYRDELFELVAKYGQIEYADYFDEISELNPEYDLRRQRLAVTALYRLGLNDVGTKHVNTIVLKGECSEVEIVDFYFAHNPQPKAFASYLAQTRAVEKGQRLWNIARLFKHRVAENTVILTELLLEEFEALLQTKHEEDRLQAYALYQQLSVIEMLGELNYGGVEKLRGRVPNRDWVWMKTERDASEFVSWVNKNCNPRRKVTVDSVLELEEYLNDGEYYDRECFVLTSLKSAGCGEVVEPDDYGSVAGLLEGITKKTSQPTMTVAACDGTEETESVVINNLVYEFKSPESDAWYEVIPACEILNAIAKRQKISERYFVLQESFGNSYCKFVIFTKPRVAQRLAEKFEFKFVPGCEKHWQSA